MADNPHNLTGKMLRGYELRQLVDTGGFGAVYNAYQRIIEREVAIKIILPRHASQPDFIRRFEVEARIVARLEHMNIVPLYDFWRDPSGAYLVMRWLRGGNLRHWLRQQGQLTPRDILHVLSQISAALEVAHERGIIHRDIKPDNILLDEHGNAFLTDFGIAFDFLHHPHETQHNLSFGSVDYMAPEQISGKIITPEADVYSLGILIFELLTGERPFKGQTTTAIIKKQTTDPIPSIQMYRTDLPPQVDNVVWQATAKNPANRYESTSALFRAFHEAVLPLIDKETQINLPQPAYRTRDDPDGQPTGHVSGGIETNIFDRPQTAPVSMPASVTGSFNLDSRLLRDDTPATRESLYPVEDMPDISNPYRGLRPFEEADASNFYGRENPVNQMLDRLIDQNFLAVVGPGGSGKSSLVKAGLLSRLRDGAIPDSENWYIASMVPGPQPYRELSAALLQIATRAPDELETLLRGDNVNRQIQDLLPEQDHQVLLFIDQFEEVFTQVDDEAERTAFLETLTHLVDGDRTDHPIRLILTLRADFYDRPLLYTGFGELVQQNTMALLPLSIYELEDVITGPTHNINVFFDPDLVTEIIQTVHNQPGTLPLLQYALTELFDNRSGTIIDLETYRQIGGVTGALARRATDIYQDLSTEDQEQTRRLFLKLVTVNADGRTTRRRLLWSDVMSRETEQKRMQTVIDLFSQFRLITLDRDPETRSPTVEIAHEALIHGWHDLNTWINRYQADLQTLQRLRQATTEWLNANQDDSFLARGTRLAVFETLLQETDLIPGEDETRFIHASIHLRDRLTRRNRLVTISMGIITVLAVLLTVFAFDRQQQARTAQAEAIVERDRANVAAQTARSRELAAQALSLSGENDLSLLLSVEAFNIAETYEARNSLFTGLQVNPFLHRYLPVQNSPVRSVAYSPDGHMIVSGNQAGEVIRWQANDSTLMEEPVSTHTERVNQVAVSPDGKYIVSVASDGNIIRQDTDSGDQTTLDAHNAAIWSLAFSPDASLFATGDASGTIMLWQTTGDEPIMTLEHSADTIIHALAFSPDGQVLASAGDDNLIQLWNLQEERPDGQVLTGHNSQIFALAFSPDGQVLASASADAQVLLWRAVDRVMITGFATGHSDMVRDLAFDSSGQILATASMDRTIRLWNIAQQQLLIQPLTGHSAAVRSVAFHPDMLRLLSGGEDGRIIIWDFAVPARPGETAYTVGYDVQSVAISPDGDFLVTGGNPTGRPEKGTISLWDTQNGERIAHYDDYTGVVTAIAISPDNQYILTGSANQDIRLRERATGEQHYPPLTAHQNVVRDVVFSPDGDLFYSGDDDSRLMSWHTDTGEAASGTILLENDGILALAVSPDGRYLAGGGRDGSITMLSTDNIQIIHRSGIHDDAVTGVVFSSDSSLIFSVGRDNQLTAISVETGAIQQQIITEHTDWILDVNISPDNRLLATTGRDGAVILYDPVSLRQFGFPLIGHVNSVTDGVFSPDGRYFYSTGTDRTLVAWQVAEDDWYMLACFIAGRDFTQAEWQQYFPDQAYQHTCDN